MELLELLDLLELLELLDLPGKKNNFLSVTQLFSVSDPIIYCQWRHDIIDSRDASASKKIKQIKENVPDHWSVTKQTKIKKIRQIKKFLIKASLQK